MLASPSLFHAACWTRQVFLDKRFAGKNVAMVSHTRSGQGCSEHYSITFEERHASWDVIDSRGIFVPVPPNGAEEKDALTQLRRDLRNYRLDLIMHVIIAPEIRTLSPDWSDWWASAF